MRDNDIGLHLIDDDLYARWAFRIRGTNGGAPVDRFLFDPAGFDGKELDMSLACHALKEDALVEYGRIISQLRSDIRERAQEVAVDNDRQLSGSTDSPMRFARELYRKYSRIDRVLNEPKSEVQPRDVLVPARRRRLNVSQVSNSTLSAIVEQYRRRDHRLSDLSQMYNVTPNLVKNLVRDPDSATGYLATLLGKRDRKSRLLREVTHQAEMLVEQGRNIWRASQVREAVRSGDGGAPTDAFVAKVLRNHLHMRYKKVKRTPYPCNWDINVVKRQRYSETMVQLLQAGKRVLCIDETALVVSDNRQRKWCR